MPCHLNQARRVCSFSIHIRDAPLWRAPFVIRRLLQLDLGIGFTMKLLLYLAFG